MHTPIVALIYDFDKTLSPKDMQEYSFIPGLNMEADALLFSFNPKRTRAKGTDESHRAIDYPVFCNPAETPVTVERIKLIYSAFASSES